MFTSEIDTETEERAPMPCDLFAPPVGEYEIRRAGVAVHAYGWCSGRSCYQIEMGPGTLVPVSSFVDASVRELAPGAFISVIGETAACDLVPLIRAFKGDLIDRGQADTTFGDGIYWGFPIHITITGERQPSLFADWITLVLGPDRPEPLRKSVAVSDEFLIEVRSARQLGVCFRAITGRQSHTPIYLIPKDGTPDQWRICEAAARQHPQIRAVSARSGASALAGGVR